MRDLQIAPDRAILVHSSLSALGFVPGGVQTVLAALKAYMDPGCLIVMPTHSWHQVANGLREFDVNRTPSCVGAITESFRLMPGVERSLHPTHSLAALGNDAGDLLRDHELSIEPCGKTSPYYTLLQSDATVFFLGAGFESNTSYHCVEAVCQVPYLLMDQPEEFVIVDKEGKRRSVHIRRHQAGIRRNLGQLFEAMNANGMLRCARVGKSSSMAFSGLRFLDFLSDRLASDKNYLLDGQDASR